MMNYDVGDTIGIIPFGSNEVIHNAVITKVLNDTHYRVQVFNDKTMKGRMIVVVNNNVSNTTKRMLLLESFVEDTTFLNNEV